MKVFKASSVAVMIAALALSACAARDDRMKGEGEGPPSAGDVVDLGLVIDGKPIDEILDQDGAGEAVLLEVFGDSLQKDGGRERLQRALRNLDEGKPPGREFDDLRGLAGFSASELAQRILFPQLRRETRGLIGDFLTFYEKGKDGRIYGDGHLSVETETKVFQNDRQILKIVYHWHIEVLRNKKYDGYVVLERQGDPNDPNDPNFPDNPFPNTVAFPDYTLDPADRRSIWSRGLDHKLFAEGEEVVVRDVFVQINDGEITRLPDRHVFYDSTPESCIDLMTRGFPPEFRIEFPEQSGYCLGRCAQPNVFNSM